MNRSYIPAGLISLALLLSIACNSIDNKSKTAAQRNSTVPGGSTQVDTQYADGAKRITISEAQQLINAGKAFVVDVRNQQAYDQGHIPGAKLIPSGEILNHLSELPSNKTIITYCS